MSGSAAPSSSPDRALQRALDRALPPAQPAAVLRAALGGGRPDGDGFQRWADKVGDPRRLGPVAKRAVQDLGPLLEHTRRSTGAQVTDRTLAATLQAAGQREVGRWDRIGEAAAEMVAAVGAADEAVLIVGGAAVALTAYPMPPARHSHDLDLVTDLVDAPGAQRNRLAAICAEGPTDIPGGGWQAVHRSRLSLWGHRSTLPPPWSALGTEEVLRARAVPAQLGGTPIALPCSGHLLVAVLVHALASRPARSVRWAADATLLARTCADTDWQLLLAASQQGLAPALRSGLRFITAELGAAVPQTVFDRLEHAPSPSPEQQQVLTTWAQRVRARYPLPRRAVGRMRRAVAR